jgi:hypothetical protein
MKTKLVVLAIAGLTAIHPAWLEWFGIDPDHGNGGFETMLVLACVLVVIGAAVSLVRTRR